jgi:hypothetical protein
VAVPTEICRANSPEGEFLRGANIDKSWVTSSGYMNCVSASGKYLGQMASVKSLEEFRKLPESERGPGAVQVPDLKPTEVLIPSPPPGGIVLKVFGRFLARDESGGLRPAQGEDFPQFHGDEESIRYHRFLFEPNTEYLWMTQAEWQSLVPSDPAPGDRFDVAPALAERLARFHLSPRRALTSEDGIVPKKEVRTARLALQVENVTAQQIRLRLTGFVHTGSEFDAAKATSPQGPLAFGYATPMHGILVYDRARQALVRFDMVAPGDVWGR